MQGRAREHRSDSAWVGSIEMDYVVDCEGLFCVVIVLPTVLKTMTSRRAS